MMAKGASIGCLWWLADVTSFLLYMLVIGILVDAFFTSGALFELSCLITLSEKVLVVSSDFNDLAAVHALSKHKAVFPEMHIKVLRSIEAFILFATELAALLLFLLV